MRITDNTRKLKIMHNCEQKCEQVDTYNDSRSILQEQVPELLPLAQEIVNAIELTFLKVTANFADPGTFPLGESHEGSLEMLLSKRLSALSDLKKKVAINNVKSAIENLDILREGKYSNLSGAGVLDKLKQPEPIFESASDLFLKHGKSFRKKIKFFGEVNEDIFIRMRPEFDKIALRIHRVKCLVETSGGGDDEIELAAVITQPSGATSKLGPQVISNDFDDGEEVYFGNWYYAFYDLWNPDHFLGFPKLCQCTFILSEVDNGGLPTMVQIIYDKIKEKVASAIGIAVGTLVGSLAGPVGAAVGAAVGFAMGALFRFFQIWWEDDLFPPATVGAMIPSFDARWNGSTISPQYSCYFKEHGGLYRIDYSWQFVK